MLRIISTAIVGLALALPMGAIAGTPVDEKAPELAIAANEDAVVLPAPASRAHERSEVTEPAKPRRAARGSSQSAAEFRFTNPYAFPIQTLPMVLPNVTTYSF